VTSLVTPISFGASGRLVTTDNPTVIARDQIKDVVVTNLNERVMRPAYGGGVSGALFTSPGDLVLADIAQTIKEQCAAHVSMAQVSNCSLRWEMRPNAAGTGSDSVLVVTVIYEIPPDNNPQTATYTFTGYLTQES
jgi:phage baseplate assembly protein W